METRKKIDLAISAIYPLCKGKKNVNRVKLFMDKLKEFGVESTFVGDKPAKGMSFFCKDMKDVFRVNVRCGYSKYNYAPCVEIKK